MTSARLSFQDTCVDLSWRLQAVQQYTHEDHNPDRIKLKASQKIFSPIIRSLRSTMKSKVFRNLSESIAGIENFVGSSVGCLKITKLSDVNLTLTRRSHFKLKYGPHVQRRTKFFRLRFEQPHISLKNSMSNAGLKNPVSNASLKNPASQFKRESE